MINLCNFIQHHNKKMIKNCKRTMAAKKKAAPKRKAAKRKAAPRRKAAKKRKR